MKKKLTIYILLLKRYFLNSVKIFPKKDAKFRIIRLFHVYGRNENRRRLWPALILSAKKEKDFMMSPGSQYTDFNFIDNVVEGLISSLNFNYKKVTFLKFGKWVQEKKCQLKSLH